uniref:BTB/POZ domain-containing protein kctd15-like n=1 Tax=Styela clava TaxID=7725 RepID=UPI00193954E7|nr:BTB/POZ domain-containing protein kctd15-like [Styela clava]
MEENDRKNNRADRKTNNEDAGRNLSKTISLMTSQQRNYLSDKEHLNEQMKSFQLKINATGCLSLDDNTLRTIEDRREALSSSTLLKSSPPRRKQKMINTQPVKKRRQYFERSTSESEGLMINNNVCVPNDIPLKKSQKTIVTNNLPRDIFVRRSPPKHQPVVKMMVSEQAKRTKSSENLSLISQISNTPQNSTVRVSGIPTPAIPNRYTAPVHIDVGGHIYTSSLETLTKYPDSKLGKLFNGAEPIVLDALKQHYFLDRDGNMFRYILNFLRTSTLDLPQDFQELDLLMQEAQFFELDLMLKLLTKFKQKREAKKRQEFLICRTIQESEQITLSGSAVLVNEILHTPDRKSEHSKEIYSKISCDLESVEILQRALDSGCSMLNSVTGKSFNENFVDWIFSRDAQEPTMNGQYVTNHKIIQQ